MNKRNYKKRTIRRRRRSQRGGAPEDNLYVRYDGSSEQSLSYDMKITTWNQLIDSMIDHISISRLGLRKGQDKESLTILVGDENKNLINEINEFLPTGKTMDNTISDTGGGKALVNAGLASEIGDDGTLSSEAKYLLHNISRDRL